MLPKDLIKAALKFQDLPRIPVHPVCISWWAFDHFGYTVMDVFKDAAKGVDAQLRTLELLNFDVVESFWDWYCILEPLGCKTKIVEKGNPYVLDFPIKKPEDLKDMTVPDFKKDWRIDSALEAAAILKDKAEDYFLFGTFLGPMSLAGIIRDLENVMKDIAKRPDFVHELMAFSRDVLLEQAKMFVPHLDAIMYCDPTASGDLISPQHNRTFLIPYLKKLNQDTRKLGVHVFNLICGNVTNRLEDIAELEAEAFSLDHMVDLTYAREKIKDKMALMGNIDPVLLLSSTPAQIEKISREAISKAGRKGFILAPGSDIPLESPIDNIKTILNVASRP